MILPFTYNAYSIRENIAFHVHDLKNQTLLIYVIETS